MNETKVLIVDDEEPILEEYVVYLTVSPLRF